MEARVHGILKDAFYLDQTFANVAHAKSAAKNTINLYNEGRLHLYLNHNTPNMIYLKTNCINFNLQPYFRTRHEDHFISLFENTQIPFLLN
jgi:hypothetical protein